MNFEPAALDQAPENEVSDLAKLSRFLGDEAAGRRNDQNALQVRCGSEATENEVSEEPRQFGIWEPFKVAQGKSRPELTRTLPGRDGIGDRLRAAAFAEIQANQAFAWAAHHFSDTPVSLKKAWLGLALAEEKHLNWLLNRMKELQIDVQERLVSDRLWHSLIVCKSAEEFSVFMANAEERGRQAGVRFYKALVDLDPISADIFLNIANEEVAHITLAKQYFPEAFEKGFMGWKDLFISAHS